MSEILDACCGSRMFYYDRNNTHTVYMDNRRLNTVLCDGRTLHINPDIIGDFRNIQFENETFNVVIFDPPHLWNAGKKSWLAQKYGTLPGPIEFADYLRDGFKECFRVLKPFGVLAFKWNNEQIPFAEVIGLSPEKPLLGDKTGKTRWTIFVKGAVK